MLSVGDPFPSFDLPDQDGKIHSSAALAGQRYLVYFYPKDDTPGCTAQACALRDSWQSLKGVNIFGVSPDSVKQHKKFAEKFQLPFPLLADVDHVIIDPCGVWVEKTMYGKKYMGIARTTFVVASDGQIEQVWEKVDPSAHINQVLSLLK